MSRQQQKQHYYNILRLFFFLGVIFSVVVVCGADELDCQQPVVGEEIEINEDGEELIPKERREEEEEEEEEGLTPKIKRDYFNTEGGKVFDAVIEILDLDSFLSSSLVIYHRGEGEEGKGEEKEDGEREWWTELNFVYGYYREEECRDLLVSEYGFQTSQMFTGPLFFKVVMAPASAFLPEFVPPQGPCAGIGVAVSGCNIKQKDCIRFPPFDDINSPTFTRQIVQWIVQQGGASLMITNEMDDDIQVNWVQEGWVEREASFIPAKETRTIKTSISHFFSAHTAHNGEQIAVKAVTTPLDTWTIQKTSIPIEASQKVANQNWIGSREARNFLQSRVIRPVTPQGFLKKPLPSGLYQKVLEFLDRNRDNFVLESHVGPCLNQEKANTYLLDLPQDLKNEISREFKPLLEEWSGETLKMTALYGIRKYSRNSLLEMHTDTAHTHAISAIVNVDQLVDEDWPLEIYGHDDKLHQIVMQPGDMVFYESARLIHGRTLPLNGSEYLNFFIHFRPVEDSRWDYLWL